MNPRPSYRPVPATTAGTPWAGNSNPTVPCTVSTASITGNSDLVLMSVVDRRIRTCSGSGISERRSTISDSSAFPARWSLNALYGWSFTTQFT